jgi:hypothetical protein
MSSSQRERKSARHEHEACGLTLKRLTRQLVPSVVGVSSSGDGIDRIGEGVPRFVVPGSKEDAKISGLLLFAASTRELDAALFEPLVALQSDRTPPLHPRWHKTWASGV